MSFDLNPVVLICVARLFLNIMIPFPQLRHYIYSCREEMNSYGVIIEIYLAATATETK